MDVHSIRPDGAEHPAPSAVLLRFNDVADRLGISRSKLYALAATGDIETVTIGRSRRIPSDAVDTFIAGLRRHPSQAVGTAQSGSARRSAS